MAPMIRDDLDIVHFTGFSISFNRSIDSYFVNLPQLPTSQKCKSFIKIDECKWSSEVSHGKRSGSSKDLKGSDPWEVGVKRRKVDHDRDGAKDTRLDEQSEGIAGESEEKKKTIAPREVSSRLVPPRLPPSRLASNERTEHHQSSNIGGEESDNEKTKNSFDDDSNPTSRFHPSIVTHSGRSATPRPIPFPRSRRLSSVPLLAPTRLDTRAPPSARPLSSTTRSLRLRDAIRVIQEPTLSLGADLTLEDYEPYLSIGQSITPVHSFEFLRLQLDFFTSISHQHNWSSRPHAKIFHTPVFSKVHSTLLETQPNLPRISNMFRPAWVEPSRQEMIEADRSPLWFLFWRVLRWIFDLDRGNQFDFRTKKGKSKIVGTVVGFLERAPLPLVTLVRVHVDTLRYATAVFSAQNEFVRSLTNHTDENVEGNVDSGHVTRARAKVLMDWLTRLPRRDDREGDVEDRTRMNRWNLWWTEETERARLRRKSSSIAGSEKAVDVERDEMESLSDRWVYQRWSRRSDDRRDTRHDNREEQMKELDRWEEEIRKKGTSRRQGGMVED